MEEKIFYIYAHVNPINRAIFYIGKGKNKRAYAKERRSDRWQNYINKHGYEILILEENLLEKDAFKLEVFYIKEFGRLDLGTGLLINMSDGGAGGNNNKGRKFSEEWLKNMSLCQMGNTRNKGRKKSEEEKRKMSERLKGRSAYWLKGKPRTPEQNEYLSKKFSGSGNPRYGINNE